jgi:hypothetical protein
MLGGRARLVVVLSSGGRPRPKLIVAHVRVTLVAPAARLAELNGYHLSIGIHIPMPARTLIQIPFALVEIDTSGIVFFSIVSYSTL